MNDLKYTLAINADRSDIIHLSNKTDELGYITFCNRRLKWGYTYTNPDELRMFFNSRDYRFKPCRRCGEPEEFITFMEHSKLKRLELEHQREKERDYLKRLRAIERERVKATYQGGLYRLEHDEQGHCVIYRGEEIVYVNTWPTDTNVQYAQDLVRLANLGLDQEGS